MKSHKNKLLSSTVMAMMIGTGVAAGASVALAATGSEVVGSNADATSQNPTAVQVASGCNPCNPCAASNPCNPCNPCAVKKKVCNPCNPCNPCAAKNPCNPCAAKNPCNPCNPCAAN